MSFVFPDRFVVTMGEALMLLVHHPSSLSSFSSMYVLCQVFTVEVPGFESICVTNILTLFRYFHFSD